MATYKIFEIIVREDKEEKLIAILDNLQIPYTDKKQFRVTNLDAFNKGTQKDIVS